MKLITLFILLTVGAWGQVGVDWVTEPSPNIVGTTLVHSLTSTNSKLAHLGFIPKAGSITHVIIQVASVTSAQTLKVGVYTVASQDSTGNAYGGMVAGTQESPAANTTYRIALGTAATATLGDEIAVVTEYNGDAGTLGIAACAVLPEYGVVQGRFRCRMWNGSAWAASAGEGGPSVLVEYSDGDVLPITPYHVYPSSTSTNYGKTSASADPHLGIYFTPSQSLRAEYVCVKGGNWVANATTIFRITDTSRNTLASTGTVGSVTESGLTQCYPLTTQIVLQKNVKYYMLSIPQTTNSVSLQLVTKATGWRTYSSRATDVGYVNGTQSTALTESNDYTITMWLVGKRITATGGFSTVQ